jgi:hypothetical protein
LTIQGFVLPAVIKASAIRAHSTGKEYKMRRIHNYRITKESFWEMLHAKRHNPCLVITFRDKSGQHTHRLSAGYGDVLDIYREGTETYVLSSNPRLYYVGLEAFEGAEKQGSIFLQGDQVKEILGRDDLAPLTIIKRLKNYVYSH